MANDVRSVDHFDKNSCSGNDCNYVPYVLVLRHHDHSLTSLRPQQRQYSPKPGRRRLLGYPQPPAHHVPSYRAHLVRSWVARRVLRPLLPYPGHGLWYRCARDHPVSVSSFPSEPCVSLSFVLTETSGVLGRLGAAVLSHHVDKFSLASAFFLFSIGCLNMLLGIVFRDRARAIRSIRAHRREKKDVLPTNVHGAAGSGGHASISGPIILSEKEKEAMGMYRSDSTSSAGSSKSGLGFGRQGDH